MKKEIRVKRTVEVCHRCETREATIQFVWSVRKLGPQDATASADKRNARDWCVPCLDIVRGSMTKRTNKPKDKTQAVT